MRCLFFIALLFCVSLVNCKAKDWYQVSSMVDEVCRTICSDALGKCWNVCAEEWAHEPFMKRMTIPPTAPLTQEPTASSDSCRTICSDVLKKCWNICVEERPYRLLQDQILFRLLNPGFGPHSPTATPMEFYDGVKACLEETDSSMGFGDRVLLCGGFFAHVRFQDQSCTPVPEDGQPPCRSRYRINSIVHPPETDTLVGEFFHVREYPLFSGYDGYTPSFVYISPAKDIVHILRAEHPLDQSLVRCLRWSPAPPPAPPGLQNMLEKTWAVCVEEESVFFVRDLLEILHSPGIGLTPPTVTPLHFYDEIKTCLGEMNSFMDFESRVLSCGGFFANAILEEQSCAPVPEDGEPPCHSRYRIIHVTHPTVPNTLEGEYLYVREFPAFVAHLYRPIFIYVNHTKSIVHILRGEPVVTEN